MKRMSYNALWVLRLNCLTRLSNCVLRTALHRHHPP